MSGHRPFRELLEKMSPERRARIAARVEAEAAEIRFLIELERKGLPDPYCEEAAE